jgi:hypothetical protein
VSTGGRQTDTNGTLSRKLSHLPSLKNLFLRKSSTKAESIHSNGHCTTVLARLSHTSGSLYPCSSIFNNFTMVEPCKIESLVPLTIFVCIEMEQREEGFIMFMWIHLDDPL